MALYRNNDMEFERVLARPTAERKMAISFVLNPTADGFSLSATDESGRKGRATCTLEHQTAQKPQEENIRRQLSKLGNTPYVAADICIDDDVKSLFLPSSVLAELRRESIDLLQHSAYTEHQVGVQTVDPSRSSFHGSASDALTLANVANSKARQFYHDCGISGVPEAYEVASDKRIAQFDNRGEAVADLSHIMTCRYCLRYTLGYCVKHGGKQPTWKEPLFLSLPDGKRFKLQFDCKHCQMNIYAQHA